MHRAMPPYFGGCGQVELDMIVAVPKKSTAG
jgi:hypothetical protein